MNSPSQTGFAAWLWLVAILSTMPVLRVGDVQAVEIAQIVCLSAILPVFVYRGLKIPAGGLWRQYGGRYLLFLGLCAVLSLVALRLPFYPPADSSWLKRPGLLPLARIFELFLATYFTIAIAETLRRRPRLARTLMDAYTCAATLGACCSIAAWVLHGTAGTATFFLYGADWRVRGLFNEGGPYGIFLVSAVLLVLLRMHIARPVIPVLNKGSVVVLLIALWLSGSKAGLLAATGLCLIAVVSSQSKRRLFVFAAALALLLVGFGARFRQSLAGYAWSYLNFDEAYFYRPDDPSLIMGRIAATLIVPRMIASHPLLGIGLGNYSLMRNDPDYLQELPPVDNWDLSGLGLLGSTAELGVPLALFLLALLGTPLLRAWRRKAPLIVIVTAGFQPIAFLLGVNLNFFYPWLVAALVLSLEPIRSVGEGEQ